MPEGVGRGAVVSMRFGRARARGVVTEVGVEAPAGVEAAAVERVVEELPAALVDLAFWVAEYYGSTPARALALVAPLKRARRGERREPYGWQRRDWTRWHRNGSTPRSRTS